LWQRNSNSTKFCFFCPLNKRFRLFLASVQHCLTYYCNFHLPTLFSVKSIPYYVIEVVTCIIVWYSWSDKLLTALDAKLERLEYAILFIIADMHWLEKRRTRPCKNLTTENSFALHSPLFFHSPLQKFHSPWGETPPNDEDTYCVKGTMYHC